METSAKTAMNVNDIFLAIGETVNSFCSKFPLDFLTATLVHRHTLRQVIYLNLARP